MLYEYSIVGLRARIRIVTFSVSLKITSCIGEVYDIYLDLGSRSLSTNTLRQKCLWIFDGYFANGTPCRGDMALDYVRSCCSLHYLGKTSASSAPGLILKKNPTTPKPVSNKIQLRFDFCETNSTGINAFFVQYAS